MLQEWVIKIAFRTPWSVFSPTCASIPPHAGSSAAIPSHARHRHCCSRRLSGAHHGIATGVHEPWLKGRVARMGQVEMSVFGLVVLAGSVD